MKDFLNKFKIPTLLGLGIIFLGLGSGIFLVLRDQIFLSQAAPSVTAQNITFTNQTENSVVISWQTNSPAASFISFNQEGSGEETVLDDRDQTQSPQKPKERLIHYVTLKNLTPKTGYQFKIISGRTKSDIFKFETPNPLTNQAQFTPVIGSVMNEDNPLNEGVAYLSIPEAITQSALIKDGNFLIPVSQIAKTDLSGDFPLTDDTLAKLTIRSDKGESAVLFKLKPNLTPLPPVKLGQNIDLTTQEPTPFPTPTLSDLNKFDLNSDGKINSADNAIVLQNFGKNPKNKKADLNEDETVDQKDLDLMSEEITRLGVQ